MPPFPGLRLPNNGISTKKITGNEMAAILLVIAPALLLDLHLEPLVPSIIGESYCPLLKDNSGEPRAKLKKIENIIKFLPIKCNIFLIAALLEWHQLANYEIHTEATIAELRERCLTLQAEILKLKRGGKEWAIPKFFNIRKFHEYIELVASAPFTDTGFLEALHKALKGSAGHTNNRPNDMDTQLSKHAQRSAAAQRILDAVQGASKELEGLSWKRLSMVSQILFWKYLKGS